MKNIQNKKQINNPLIVKLTELKESLNLNAAEFNGKFGIPHYVWDKTNIPEITKEYINYILSLNKDEIPNYTCEKIKQESKDILKRIKIDHDVAKRLGVTKNYLQHIKVGLNEPSIFLSYKIVQDQNANNNLTATEFDKVELSKLKTTVNELSERLRMHMDVNKMSANDIAKDTNISVTTVRNILHNKFKKSPIKLTIESLKKLLDPNLKYGNKVQVNVVSNSITTDNEHLVEKDKAIHDDNFEKKHKLAFIVTAIPQETYDSFTSLSKSNGISNAEMLKEIIEFSLQGGSHKCNTTEK